MAKRYYFSLFITLLFCVTNLCVNAQSIQEIDGYLSNNNLTDLQRAFWQQKYNAEKERIADSLASLDNGAVVGSSHSRAGAHGDCATAIPVCQQTYTESVTAPDRGNVQELSGTCLASNEQRTMWYVFTTQNAGTFGFLIQTPRDYDWALFDITGSSCAAISAHTLSPVRCNYSGTYGNTGLNANSPSNTIPLSNSSSGGPIMPGLNVQPGHTYVLVIDNFTGDASGYTLTFQGTASIYDNTPPTITGTATLDCQTAQFGITFSEAVKCSDLVPANFTITGGTPASIPVTAITGVGCGVSSTTSQAFLSYDPMTVLAGGPYSVTGTTFADKCGNVAVTTTASVAYTVPPLPTYTGSIACGSTTMRVTFSAPIRCSSVQATDFSVSGGLTIMSAIPTNCSAIGTTTTVDVEFSAPVVTGTYVFSIVGTILSSDCIVGYPIPTGTVYTYNYAAPEPINTTGAEFCLAAPSPVTLSLANVDPSATVSWLPSGGIAGGTPVGTTYEVTPAQTTTYTATISLGGCSETTNITIVGTPNPVVSIVKSPICSANTPLSAVASLGGGACTGCTYSWAEDGAAFSSSQDIIGTPNHTYTVTVTSPVGCSASASRTISGSSNPSCSVLYASPSGTGSGLNPASPTTIENAVALAGANNVVIKMTTGVYNISEPLVLNCYNQLEGGWNANYTSKTSDMSGGPNTTVIARSTAVDPGSDPATIGVAPRVTGIIIPASSQLVELHDIRINMPDEVAGSRITNYGIYVGSGATDYKIIRCYVYSGNGAPGVNGTPGAAGAAGGNAAWSRGQSVGGNALQNACVAPMGDAGLGGLGGGGILGGGSGTNVQYGCGSAVLSYGGAAGTGRDGGGGGSGGMGAFSIAGAAGGGGGGAGGGVVGGGGGAAGGSAVLGYTGTAASGTNGSNGAPGVTGADGVTGTASFTAGYFLPGVSTSGADGTGGGGGGGGGGGAGKCCWGFSGVGAGGGGGGGGGQGGTGGGAAASAGGTFCLFVYNAGTGGQVVDCQFETGTVGGATTGGARGAGGAGGAGNCPGAASGGQGGGGCGGNGGTGGNGGLGGNGTAGVAARVYVSGGNTPSYTSGGTPAVLAVDAVNNPAVFPLNTQTVINVAGNACTGQPLTHTTAVADSWTFGANSSPSSAGASTSAVTQYSASGRATVSLGASNYTEFNNIITNPPALPGITSSSIGGCSPTTIWFTTTNGNELGFSYDWSVINPTGGSSTVFNPLMDSTSVAFINPSDTIMAFVVQCVITSNCCGLVGTAYDTIHVYPTPVPPTVADINQCVGSPATFTATAPANTNFLWYLTATGGTPSGVGVDYGIATTPAGITTIYIESSNDYGCVSPTRTAATLTSIDLNTITHASPVSVCVNSAITPITLPTTGLTDVLATGLPNGLIASFSANTITISGTPDTVGTFTYILEGLGGCPGAQDTSTITVIPTNTIDLGLSDFPCVGQAMEVIELHTTGATGVAVTWTPSAPSGITATWASDVLTISGIMPDVNQYTYTAITTGGCGADTATGILTGINTNTITLTSSAGTDNQIVCTGEAITTITYVTTGAKGADFTGLPAGVTGVWDSSGTVTISGVPTVAGTYNYVVNTLYGCPPAAASGTIFVGIASDIALTSAAGTDSQLICVNAPLTDITYAVTGGAAGASIVWSPSAPAGVSSSYSGGTFTITGTPSMTGVYNYTITTTGNECSVDSVVGVVSVKLLTSVSAASSSPEVCINTPIPTVAHTTVDATGIGTPSGLPNGVTAVFNLGAVVITGSPTESGTFNYTIPITGGCIPVNAIGTILVNPNTTGVDTQYACDSYTWINGVTYTASNNTAIHTLFGANSNGCDSIVQLNLTIYRSPAVTPRVVNAMCADSSSGSLVWGVVGAGGYSYDWLPNVSTDSFAYGLLSGTYSVTVTDMNSCTTSATAIVSEPQPLQVSLAAVNVKCYNEKNGSIQVTTHGGIPPYRYSIVDGQNNSDGSFTHLDIGTYNVSVVDANNCLAYASTYIAQPDSLTAYVEPTDSLIMDLGATQVVTVLSNTAGVTYNWSPLNGIGCADCASNTIPALRDITYTVTVSSGPCKVLANVYVHVIPNYGMYIPNTFTPNGDGTNDNYEIFFQNPGAVKLVDFAVFNRWGEKVFESNDINFKWDGYFKGAVLNPGIYTYYLRVVFIDNHTITDQKGTITLLR